LDVTFPKRWTGRDGPTPWPPRSLDINLLDILGGCVKDKVYSTPIPDTGTLKARIRDSIVAAIEEILEKTSRETEYRLDVLGQLPEQMLKSANVAQKSFLAEVNFAKTIVCT
jgi:hypothetical protein